MPGHRARPAQAGQPGGPDPGAALGHVARGLHAAGPGRESGARSVDDAILEQVLDPALPPDLLLLAFDACQRLLGLLETDDLRQVAVWKLVGHTNEAIAAKLGRSAATVERTLSQIRDTWRRKWGDAVPRESAKSGPRRGSTQAADEPGPAPGDAIVPGPEDEARLLRDLAGLP